MRKTATTSVVPRTYPPARERLLAAALHEFGEKGFAGARVDKITQQANVNKQLVYHYFGNKEALFLAVLERAYHDYTNQALRVAVGKTDARTALRRLIDHMFKASSRTVYFNQLLQDENRFAGRHVKALPSVRQNYVKVIELVESILQRGVQEGVFRRGIDPREFYISLVGMFNIRTVNARTLGAAVGVPLESDAGMARSRAAAFDLLVHGISNGPPIGRNGRRGTVRHRGATMRRKTNGRAI